MLCSIAEYFYELSCIFEPIGQVKRVKILSDTTQKKILQEIYYPTRQIVVSMQANFMDIYLLGMHERSMRSGTELAWEILCNLTAFLCLIYLINLDQ